MPQHSTSFYKPKPLEYPHTVWLELASHGISYSAIAALYETYPMTVKRVIERFTIVCPAELSDEAKQDVLEYANLMLVNCQATFDNSHKGAIANRIAAIKKVLAIVTADVPLST